MKIFYTTLIILIPFLSFGQQLPKASNFSETNFMWNPAMTGLWNYWEVSAAYRQQWVGFADAPKTATLGFQVPFEGRNMSVGGHIMHDETHPLKFNAISLSYAYKLRTGLFYEDQLSIGIMATMTEHRLDMQEAQINDLDDGLLLGDASTTLKPNAGVGLYYSSYAGDDFNESYFYLGAAVNQFFAVDLTFDNASTANLKRAIHGNAIAGARIINGDMAIEPSVWLNYAEQQILNANIGLKMEKLNSFWAGFSYSTDQTFSLQAGVVIKNGFLKDGTLRIGTLGAYNLGGFGNTNGLGYEFYIAYRFGI